MTGQVEKEKKSERDETRTRNLLIRSQTRYHCATRPTTLGAAQVAYETPAVSPASAAPAAIVRALVTTTRRRDVANFPTIQHPLTTGLSPIREVSFARGIISTRLTQSTALHHYYCTMLDEEKPTTVGELKLSDLPPIEDLKISVPVDSLVKVGKVVQIVDVLVVIETVRSMPPLDLDTVLFKSDGNPVGQIFDVFGTITEPHYSIRFTNSEKIKEKGLQLDMEIYFSPQTDRSITKFAFVNELRKNKGTDASGEHDNELAPSSANNDGDANDYFSDHDDGLEADGAGARRTRQRI